MKGLEGISIEGGMIISASPPTDKTYLLFDLQAYEWDNTTGFGSALTTPVSAPLPSGGIGFNENATALVIQTTTTPFVEAYAWSDAGWGSKYNAPATTFDNRTFNSSRDTIKFTHAGNVVLVGISQYGGNPTNPATLVAYNWDNVNGFGSVLTSMNLGATFGSLNSIAIHPNDDAIIMVGSAPNGSSSGRAVAYHWSNSTGVGSTYTLPANIQTYGRIRSVAFSPDGNYVVFGVTNTPYILAYPWNSTTGFGSKYANPAVLPAHFSAPIAKFSQASDAIFTIGAPNGGGLGINAWSWSASGFGTKYSDPVGGGGFINGSSLVMTKDNSVIAMSGSGGPEVYTWNSSTGFGTRYSHNLSDVGWPQFG